MAAYCSRFRSSTVTIGGLQRHLDAGPLWSGFAVVFPFFKWGISRTVVSFDLDRQSVSAS